MPREPALADFALAEPFVNAVYCHDESYQTYDEEMEASADRLNCWAHGCCRDDDEQTSGFFCGPFLQSILCVNAHLALANRLFRV
jgi:hypothetical protein